MIKFKNEMQVKIRLFLKIHNISPAKWEGYFKKHNTDDTDMDHPAVRKNIQDIEHFFHYFESPQRSNKNEKFLNEIVEQVGVATGEFEDGYTITDSELDKILDVVLKLKKYNWDMSK